MSNKTAIKMFNPSMAYRRFGRSGKPLSVITLGGMRYVNGWGEPRHEVPDGMIQQCTNCVQQAFAHGINHIETAHGYGKSEHCYGIVLQQLGIARDAYYLMTKGDPKSAEDTRRLVEEQLTALRTDRIDFYAWHGINTPEFFETACCAGGPVEELLKMKQEGIIGHVGFSTHGSLKIILSAIETGLFEFVNLHYYYFLQRNRPAVDAAAARDMGVFIISPNNKGGLLYEAPETLKETTSPLTPIQWNARFCLRTPAVQTLSFGMTQVSHFDEMAGVAESGRVPWDDREKNILQALDGRLTRDPYAWWDGYEMAQDPSGINIPEILRFRRMWSCYDMDAFCSFRYNMFQEKGHWFPGAFADQEHRANIDTRLVPDSIPLKKLLAEFHDRFYTPKE